MSVIYSAPLQAEIDGKLQSVTLAFTSGQFDEVCEYISRDPDLYEALSLFLQDRKRQENGDVVAAPYRLSYDHINRVIGYLKIMTPYGGSLYSPFISYAQAHGLSSEVLGKQP